MADQQREHSNQELIDRARRHVKRLRREPADGFDHGELTALVQLLERLTGPIPERTTPDDAADQFRAEAQRQGLLLPQGRCALSDDGYHRYFDGYCQICGDPEPVEAEGPVV